MCGGEQENHCPTCWPRVVEISDLQADTATRRQRILDLDAGIHFGARLVLGFIAPSRTHFDLGYALIGQPSNEVRVGTQGDPILAGPWDAEDSDGASYRGLGQGYTALIPQECRGLIRFVPTDPAPPFRLRPAPGPLRLQAISAGETVVDLVVDVPRPQSWEEQT